MFWVWFERDLNWVYGNGNGKKGFDISDEVKGKRDKDLVVEGVI